MPARRKVTQGNPISKQQTSKAAEHEAAGTERLQKVLAAAGVGSRRDCEELILEGRVEVDGKVVQQLGTRVDPVSQRIRIDGTTLPAPRRVYYMLNKPAGVLCTSDDPSGRTRAIDLVRSNERLFTVGRLDQASEGLILLTNDGELSNKLTHPRYGIEKVYRVRVAGSPEPAVLGKLKRGIHFADGFAKVSDVRIKRRLKQSTDLEIVLREGRNREIRRLLARIGHKVLGLTRIAMGPLRLANLPSGAHRSLTREEIKTLRHAIVAPDAQSAGSAVRKPASGRGKPRRSAGQRTATSRTSAAGSTGSTAPAPKTKPRDRPPSDQPSAGVVLGGDEPLPRKQPAKPGGRKKSGSRKHSARKPNPHKPGARKPGAGTPSGRKPNGRASAKKGRR